MSDPPQPALEPGFDASFPCLLLHPGPQLTVLSQCLGGRGWGWGCYRAKPSPSSAVVPPTQEFWQRPDGQPATREHLLMALADLDELLVRATFSSMPLVASISGVSLEVAQPGPSEGPRALEVEECRCPPGYVGLSCQVSMAHPAASAPAQLSPQEGSWDFHGL